MHDAPLRDPNAHPSLDLAPNLEPRRRWGATFLLLGFACLVAALAVLAWQWAPDGTTRGSDDWRFAGRLHPMLVHLPIGLLLLVPLLEFCGIPRRFRHLQASAGFVLWIGTLLAIVAAAHGYVLARFDGIAGNGVTWHMWTGIGTAALAVITLALRLASVPAMPRGVLVPVTPSLPTAVVLSPVARRRVGATILYTLSLAALVACLGVAGHLGGQLTYGPTYLSDVAPRPIARYLGPIDDISPKQAVELDDRSPTTRASTPTPIESVPPAAAAADRAARPNPATAPTTKPSDEAVTSPAATLPATTTLPIADVAATPLAEPTFAPVSFDRDVMPVFALHCVSCHGPSKVKGGLRLDSLAELRVGGDSGENVVPGNADGSDVYHRMTLPLDDDDVMPPANARRRPTAAEIDVVKRWILEGAKG